MRARSRLNIAGHPVKNIILCSIPLREFDSVQRRMEHVVLEVGDVLHDSADAIADIYFLNRGLASFVVHAKSGKAVEVGIAGAEGMTGAVITAGLNRTIHRVVVGAAGDGFRIGAAALKKALASAPVLERKARFFSAVQSMQFAQSAACNQLHDIRQRMARWLLMTSDRVGAETLPVTHNFLSMMLGTDRVSVTERAVLLQDSGAIRYSRGKLRILDRRKLESSACECYRAIRQFNRELGLV